jgi:catechol 2,3-dioxygenase-like lactoylglutathione lyase family enzyme
VTTTAGGTAVLEKVFYTSVLVSDQDKALDFYTNVLGLEKRVENPTPDGPRFLTVGVTGDDFQLVLWPGTPGQAEPAIVTRRRRHRALHNDVAARLAPALKPLPKTVVTTVPFHLPS